MAISVNQHLSSLLQKHPSRMKDGTLYDKDFFLSPVFRSFAESLIIGLLGENCKLDIVHDFYNSDTAYTDGHTIFLNTGNGLAAVYKDLDKRALANIGLVSHECAHQLYLDFTSARKAMKTLGKGRLYGGKRAVAGSLTQEEQSLLSDMLDALADENQRSVFLYVYHQIDNIVADAHDEACLCRNFRGLIPAGIALVEESIRASSPTYEEMQSKGYKPLSILFQLVLEQARYDHFIALDQSKAMNDTVIQTLQKIKPFLELARVEDDYSARSRYLNRCLLILWPFLRETLQEESQQEQAGSISQQQVQEQSQDGFVSDSQQPEQPQSQDSSVSDSQEPGQSCSSFVPSASAIQQVLEQLQAGSQGVTPVPRNQINQPFQQKADNSTSNLTNLSEQAAQSILQSMIQTAKDRKKEKADEFTIKQDLQAQIMAASQTSPHKGLPIDIVHSQNVSVQDIACYNQIMSRVRPFSRQMQRKVGQILEDLREGGIMHHRPIGRIIEANHAFRKDGQFFADKKLPQDLPDVSIAILVDESGSMEGSRLNAAKEAAILLDDFATGLGIPIAIIGHNSYTGTSIYPHVLFERTGDKDRYHLAQMEAGYGNRDGMALNIVVDMLEKRSEEIKFLIIISDGLPNSDGYRGKEAEEDIQNIARIAKAKGIQLFAAAIGDDKENIRRIYGESFLDVSDLAYLPKMMVRLISKRII